MAITTTLRKGASGNSVKEWQKYLNTQGFNLKVDGVFGNNTESATKRFQQAKGLAADGIVGKLTVATMGGGGGPSTTNTSVVKAPNVGSAPTGPTFNTTATATPETKPLPNAPKYDTSTWDESAKGQETLGNYNTAKENLNKYGDFTYEDYKESEAVKGASDALNAHLANKPGEYQSQWQTQLDSLMDSIMNREKFSYDLNGDALYQQYKDQYTQQGKLAMADTMGQAAAMTGGYGSSYAQSVGQQAYQGQLDNLNDVVPELYAMALDKYNREGQDLYNQYGMVMDRENLDYGRYRDTVSDFLTERDYLQGRYDTERGFDYGKYVDDRNLDYTLHQDGYQKLLDSLGIAQGDYYNGADIFHSEQATKNSVAGQQFNDAMSIWGAETDQAWKDYQATEDARQYANSLLQQGYQNEFGEWEANTNNAWQQAQWDEAARQFANEEAWRQKEWDENNRRYEESKVTSSGSGGNGGNGGNGGGGNSGGGTFADTLWNATGTVDDKGNPVFRNSEGKTQAYGQGINPYTGTKHKDAKYGTFSNGYQPNNINGTKLKNSGMSTSITGKNQTIWQANGKYWLWRGDLNKYIEVDVSDLD